MLHVYINEETKFWDHSYRVFLSAHNNLTINANHEQDAIDFAIDYAEAQGWEGLFLSSEEVAELEAEGFLEDYTSGGNHGRYLNSLDISIVKLD